MRETRGLITPSNPDLLEIRPRDSKDSTIEQTLQQLNIGPRPASREYRSTNNSPTTMVGMQNQGNITCEELDL